ncbi:hypothetical protein K438DRAFT_1961236 [Mycena galopus ATCC 62051]|nr:hypothetical protein K438DRAFT_1961236 [Mycena galopus ATCC 62051]
MHLGLKSLELRVPGGVERLAEGLARIANGINTMVDFDESSGSITDSRSERVLKVVNDPWLSTAFPTLDSDLDFTWSGSRRGDNTELLVEAIRRPSQKEHFRPT